MRNNIYYLVATLVLNGSSYAGGDVVPIEEPVTIVSEKNGFYLGLGYSDMALHNDLTNEEFSASSVMLQAGYQYNHYVAIEGRYTLDIGDVQYDRGLTLNPNDHNYPTDFSNAAIFLKPMYPLGNFSIYALLGYGEVELTNIPRGDVDRAEDGFQWGLGTNYAFNDTLSGFIDYVRMYDDKGFDYRAMDANNVADAWTLGVSYNF